MPLARQACSSRIAEQSDVLLSCSLRGHTIRGRFYLLTFCSLFASFFSTPIFYNDWYQKISIWELQNILKSQRTATTHHQNAPTVKTCKKTLSGRGQTSRVATIYNTLSFFFKGPGLPQNNQNGFQNEASGHSPS